MLDFYLIQDAETKPDYPEQAKLIFAGGIGYKTFNSLVDKEVIDSKYDYYSDFRWTNEIAFRLFELIKGKNDTDLEELTQILKQAIETNSGLIAYCD